MSDLRDELYSLLVPLSGERLIVPRACVAEVIGYQPPAQMTNAPPWYAGLVVWRGRSVPVVSFEGTLGQPLPIVSTRTRIVIFHAAAGLLPGGCEIPVTARQPRDRRDGRGLGTQPTRPQSHRLESRQPERLDFRVVEST